MNAASALERRKILAERRQIALDCAWERAKLYDGVEGNREDRAAAVMWCAVAEAHRPDEMMRLTR